MNPSRKSSRCAGITILELLIVVMIIGILAGIAVPRVLNARDRGQIGAAQSDLTVIRHALAAYAADFDRYLPYAASYEDFKNKLVDEDGNPYVTWPSGQTFRWISYTDHDVSDPPNASNGDYLLIIQVLDKKKTKLQATPDGIRIHP